MSEDSVKSWMPGSKTTVTYAVRKFLKEGNGETAVAVLISEIAAGRFAVLASTFAELTIVQESGIRILLSEPASGSYATRYVYEAAGLPVALYPLFATCVDLAQQVARVRKGKFSQQTTSFIIEKILAVQVVQDIGLTASVIAQLRYLAGAVEDQAVPEELVVAAPLSHLSA